MTGESLDLTSLVVDRAFAQALTPTDGGLHTCIVVAQESTELVKGTKQGG